MTAENPNATACNFQARTAPPTICIGDESHVHQIGDDDDDDDGALLMDDDEREAPTATAATRLLTSAPGVPTTFAPSLPPVSAGDGHGDDTMGMQTLQVAAPQGQSCSAPVANGATTTATTPAPNTGQPTPAQPPSAAANATTTATTPAPNTGQPAPAQPPNVEAPPTAQHASTPLAAAAALHKRHGRPQRHRLRLRFRPRSRTPARSWRTTTTLEEGRLLSDSRGPHDWPPR